MFLFIFKQTSARNGPGSGSGIRLVDLVPSTRTNVYQLCVICICICICNVASDWWIWLLALHPDQCLPGVYNLYLQSTSLFLSNIISVSFPSMSYWSLQVSLLNLVWLKHFVEATINVHTPRFLSTIKETWIFCQLHRNNIPDVIPRFVVQCNHFLEHPYVIP